MKSITCNQCNKTVVEFTIYNDWIWLINLLDVLRLQGQITEELYNKAFDTLCIFKQFVDEVEERRENESKTS